MLFDPSNRHYDLVLGHVDLLAQPAQQLLGIVEVLEDEVVQKEFQHSGCSDSVVKEELFQLVEDVPELPHPTFPLTLGQQHLTENAAYEDHSLLQDFGVGVAGRIEEVEQLAHKLLVSPLCSEVAPEFVLALEGRDETLPLTASAFSFSQM